MSLFCPGINQKYADNGRARPVGNNNPKTSLGRNCSCYSPLEAGPSMLNCPMRKQVRFSLDQEIADKPVDVFII